MKINIPTNSSTYVTKPKLSAKVYHNEIHFGSSKISFQRTIRIPEEWRKHGGVFIPMYQKEALWINFYGDHSDPKAVKIAVGKVNAINGKPWDQSLKKGVDDYIVIPDQPWLDGINAGNGYVKQFVAMPLGEGYTVEGQVTGKEEFGGIQIIVYENKLPEIKIRERFNRSGYRGGRGGRSRSRSRERDEIGLSAGGKMKQKIYKDTRQFSIWDQNNFARVYVHIVNSNMFKQITGKNPPPTPIDAKTYTQHGFPWYDLYDEHKVAIPKSDILSKVKTMNEIQNEKYAFPIKDETIPIKDSQLIKYSTSKNQIRDGYW